MGEHVETDEYGVVHPGPARNMREVFDPQGPDSSTEGIKMIEVKRLNPWLATGKNLEPLAAALGFDRTDVSCVWFERPTAERGGRMDLGLHSQVLEDRATGAGANGEEPSDGEGRARRPLLDPDHRVDGLRAAEADDASGTEANIVVEAQLGSADQRHLQQILTYAAEENPHLIVWVAASFPEKYLSIIAELDRTGFGGARYAAVVPVFRPVAGYTIVDYEISYAPHALAERIRALSRTPPRQGPQWQQRYWQQLGTIVSSMEQTGLRPQSGSHRTMNFDTYTVGLGGIWLQPMLNTRERYVRVRLLIHGTNETLRMARYQALAAESDQIQAELNRTLYWSAPAGQDQKEIYVRMPDVDPSDEQDWPAQHRWLARCLSDMYRVFARRLPDLEAQSVGVSREADEEE